MIKREILGEVKNWLDEDRIIVIKGARQTGKTTLLLYLKSQLERSGKKTAYFSIDREFLNPIFKSPNLFFKFLKQQFFIKNSERIYLFLDEFQYLSDPGLFLKVLFDSFKKNLKIIVSGSSSLEISKTREYLTGRKIEFILERFNFREFLRATSQYKYETKFNLLEDYSEISDFINIYGEDLKVQFLDYINWGGYPEIVLTSQYEKKRKKLEEIVETYIRKDVIDKIKIGNITAYNNLISILSRNPGNVLNKLEVSNTLGINFRTVNHYLEILKHTFVLTMLPPFYTNIRKEISKMPKVYVNDIGITTLYNGVQFKDFNLIPGNIVGNFVLLTIKEKHPVYFYRTISKAEIDFIVRKDNGVIPVKVKFSKKQIKPPKIFLSFREKYNNNLSIIITGGSFNKDKDTFFIPVFILPFIEI